MSALLGEKPYPDITVAEIAARAGVSIGGFYARFASKDALLAMLELAILEEFDAIAEAHLGAAGDSTETIALAYATLLVTTFRARKAEVTQILQYASNHAQSRDRLRAFNARVHDRVRALLVGRAPERAINFALFFAGAAAREAVLTKNLSQYPVSPSDEELAAEIANAMATFLNSSAKKSSGNS